MTTARPSVEIVTMRSGLRALQDNTVGELMHPVVGPLTEAQELYVGPARLAARLAETVGGAPCDGTHTDGHVNAAPEHGGDATALTLLDVGLGAGSNAAGAWRVAQASGLGARRLRLISFERDLAALRLASQPEYASEFGLDGSVAPAVRQLLAGEVYVDSGHVWRLVLGDLPATLATLPDACADIVFWDPFSPQANPGLWNVAAFTVLRRVCKQNATVHTYSGATAVRSALLLAGFHVGTGEASGAKGSTTIAATSLVDLQTPLDRRWLERLARSSVPFPADAPSDALAQIGALRQFQA